MQETSFNNFLSDGKNGFSEAEGITVLSLFDGMSCGQLALQKIGIKVKQYYAAEIDKHAIQVTQHNFPNTIQLGDVTKVFAKDLPKIDLLIGGSPCQGFSFAGKQLAFDDPRSKLFFEFVRLKNECNPTYFMLENVKMKKEFEIIISKYMGVAPIEINSALLSAQNRVRLYWTNIANEPFGLFGDMQCMIPQPKDKGILLRDILENDVPDKYYLSEKIKTNCLTSVQKDNYVIYADGYEQDKRAYFESGKSGCLDIKPARQKVLLEIEWRIRRLTTTECKRLQTVPDSYDMSIASDTQQYRMLGNGWTVDVIAYIFSFMALKKPKSEGEKIIKTA